MNKLFPNFSLDNKIHLHLLLLSHCTPTHTHYIVNKFMSPCKLHSLVTDLSFRTCSNPVPWSFHFLHFRPLRLIWTYIMTTSEPFCFQLRDGFTASGFNTEFPCFYIHSSCSQSPVSMKGSLSPDGAFSMGQ